MGKSNYEIYAEKKQKEVLASTATLQQAIELLKHMKEHMSNDYYNASCDAISMLFNLSYEEVDRAVNGKEYWIV